MTRAAVYGSHTWRNWKHDHHWATVPSDPLGAGNTALLANLTALGVTTLAFYDVRQASSLTLSGATVTGWDDVRGSSGFGPHLDGTGHAPAWDAINLIISNAVSTQFLHSAAVSTFDMTTNGGLTLCIIGSVAMTAADYGYSIADSSSAHRLIAALNSATTNGKIQGKYDGGGTIGSTTVASDGTIRTIFLTSKSASSHRAIGIPNAAIVNPPDVTPAVGNNALTIFGFWNAGTNTGCKIRAALVLAGDLGVGSGTSYTTPMTTIDTWAATYHGRVAA